jgi:hypothetical protein
LDFRDYRVILENATFHSAYSPKLRNSAPSLNTLYTVKSAQFSFSFSPTKISLTPRFCRKRKVWLPFFAKNAQNHPKTHSYKDNAKIHSALSPTTLSYASRFRRNRGVIENLEFLDKFEEDFQRCWLYCILYVFVIERWQYKFKNRLWKSCACVHLMPHSLHESPTLAYSTWEAFFICPRLPRSWPGNCFPMFCLKYPFKIYVFCILTWQV